MLNDMKWLTPNQTKKSAQESLYKPEQRQGCRVKHSRATELDRGEGATEIDNLQVKTNAQEPLYQRERGWGEGSTFNSATVKELQKPNNVTCNTEII